MIVISKNKAGFVQGYATYLIVDHFGLPHPEGLYVYIDEMWIHPKARNTLVKKELINKLNERKNKAIYVYWEKRKLNNKIRLYEIKKIVAKINSKGE